MEIITGINLGNNTCRVLDGTKKLQYKHVKEPPAEGMFADGEFCFKITHVVHRASQIMCLLGHKFSDPEIQSELGFLPFRVIEGPDGYPLIHGVREDKVFTPTEILVMLICHLLEIDGPIEPSNRDPLYYAYGCHPNTFCIAVPTYFTHQQISSVYDAFNLVGITKEYAIVIDETTAMAMAYKQSWSFHSLREENHNVAFVDIGHASMQVCFAEVNQKAFHIFYKAYMKSVGGRNFDIVLFKHFVYKIWKDYSINVYQSAHDCVRLLDACEGLKKDLSKYNEASFSIEFSDGKIVKVSLKKEVFEKLSTPILIKIKAALQKAIHDSGLKRKKEFLSVEAVGNGCLVPAIIDIFREVFGTEPYKMTCSDEYVVRGCAFRSKEEFRNSKADVMTSYFSSNLELVSSGLRSKWVGEEDQEKIQWIRAMAKERHPLISLDHNLSDILGQNLKDLGISKNINDECSWIPEASNQEIAIMDRTKNSKSIWKAWLWRSQSVQNTDDSTSMRKTENIQNGPNNQEEEKPTLRSVFSESMQTSSKQLKSESDELGKLKDDMKSEIDELGKLKDDTPTNHCVGYFAEFNYSALKDATNNFHDSFKIGQGGFGIVYKGILHKTTVAIKMLKDGSSQGTKEFNMEVEILSKVRHPNLVTLIGACSETRALIYEYLPNGSLEDRLQCKNNSPPLSWQNRVRIAFEICSALNFLHCAKPHGIAHGDLKPDNILLDSNNVSKISDFGLCRQLDYTDSASVPFHVTDCPKGTLAYMDPEYFSTWTMTPQYDIYAFGIILLRMVTGKDPRGLRNLVEAAHEKGKVKTLIDSSAGAWPFEEAMKMISLGLRCSHPMRKNRPNLSTEVWSEIESMVDAASASVPSLFSRLVRRHQ